MPQRDALRRCAAVRVRGYPAWRRPGTSREPWERASEAAERGDTRMRRNIIEHSVIGFSVIVFFMAHFLIASAQSTPPTFSVGPHEVIVSQGARYAVGLRFWPDGTMGVLKSGNQYTFFAANGNVSSKTVGTLDNPIATSVMPRIAIQNLKNTYQYAAGGRIYTDAATGMLLMFYHAEKWPDGDSHRFYGSVGMAKSTDDGNTWVDLGEIIRASVAFGETPFAVPEEGLGFIVMGGYFYVYFHDSVHSNNTIVTNNLAVARARIADVMIVAGSVQTSSGRNTNLYYTYSDDGLVWAPRQQISFDPGETFYPTILGFGSEPNRTDRSFYIYYTYSVIGEFDRWNDAVLARRLITCECSADVAKLQTFVTGFYQNALARTPSASEQAARVNNLLARFNL